MRNSSSNTTSRAVSGSPLLISAFMALAMAVATPSAFADSKFSFTWGKRVQGSGSIVEVQRPLPAFDRINVQDGIKVILRRGAEQKLTIKADDNIEPLIETLVEGSTLQVRTRPKTSINTRNAMLVSIDYTQLNAMSISDGVSAELDGVKSTSFQAAVHDGSQLRIGDVAVNDFELMVHDGARATVGNVRSVAGQRYRVVDGARLTVESVTGERVSLAVADGAQASVRAVDTKSIEISVADGARADVAGIAHQQNYALADAASVDAQKLQGTSAHVRAADGSSLKLGLVQTLDVDVQDGSSVRYTGEPAITKRVRDGGSLRRI